MQTAAAWRLTPRQELDALIHGKEEDYTTSKRRYEAVRRICARVKIPFEITFPDPIDGSIYAQFSVEQHAVGTGIGMHQASKLCWPWVTRWS